MCVSLAFVTNFLRVLPDTDQRIDYQTLKKIVQERQKLSYSRGFFFGLSCVLTQQEKDKRNKQS